MKNITGPVKKYIARKKELIQFYGWWKAFRPEWCHDIYIRIKDHLFPWNVVKISTLSCGYQDKDQIMLHAMFQVLVNFVEREYLPNAKADRIFDENDPDPEVQVVIQRNKEILRLYSWWKAHCLAHDLEISYDEEQKYENEELEMTIRLMKVREYLWT